MVQKEVRKKTKIYGTVAVLSAIILVTLIYSFGSIPNVFPPTHMPSVVGMKSFSSLQELKNFLVNNSQGGSSFGGGPLDSKFFGSASPMATAVPSSVQQPQGFGMGNSAPAETSTTTDYSTTNIQVAGVDEADTVKTDGSYIYTVSTTQSEGYYNGYYSQTNNAVYILSADPQDPHVVGKINLGNETEPAGLFLSQDGNRLVVLASKYQTFGYGGTPYPVSGSGGFAVPMLMSYQADVYTYINVYDVTNKADPVLTRNFTVTGSYFNSRMIGNYVYAVVSQPAAVYNNVVTLPAVYEGGSEHDVNPTTIYYSDMVQPSYLTYTGFYGVNVLDDSEQPTNMTVMMGSASTMYVSASNIYVTYPTWDQTGEYTSIYRVSVNGSQLTFQAKGNVPGYVLNQYSMDEYNGYFRIATNWQGQTEMNNVYVLDGNLGLVGKLENIAQGESLYAARFMGDKCYLVTFHQTDPFFVIDLSTPSAPKVAGELKIPGYSSFLQPYDENHVIGLGMQNTIEASGYETSQLKLALFDVSDLSNPTQIAIYTVEGNYTSSTALNDPKAILFDLQKQLLVIPVSITNYGYYQPEPQNTAVIPPPINFGGGVSSSNGTATANTTESMPSNVAPAFIISTTENWQGAYVFGINPTSGFTLKSTVTHLNAATLNSQGYATDSSTFYQNQDNYITRALYIDNTLYTISNAEIKLNSLTDLSQTGQVDLTA